MTKPQLVRIGEHLQRLKRFRVQERLDTLLHEASAQELPDADCLDRLLTEEVTAKEEKPVTMRPAMARFPYRKTLESFAFGFPPAVERKKLPELATGRFLEHGENLVFLGPPGTGKTHLAIALGLKAVHQGHRTLFTSAMSLIATRTKAYAENRLAERLKPYSLPKRLSIDEIGSLPIDQHGAHLCFQLISRRYARGAIVLTSNQSFGQWGEAFGNAVLATAILDRLLPHSVVITSKGDSSRLREKQTAGLLKKPDTSLAS
jgi:DNA replication protein DnaC